MSLLIKSSLKFKFVVRILLTLFLVWMVLGWIFYSSSYREWLSARNEFREQQQYEFSQMLQNETQWLKSNVGNVLGKFTGGSPLNFKDKKQLEVDLDLFWNNLRKDHPTILIQLYTPDAVLARQWSDNSQRLLVDRHIKRRAALAQESLLGISYIDCTSSCYLYSLKSIADFSRESGFLQIGISIDEFLYDYSLLNRLDVFAMRLADSAADTEFVHEGHNFTLESNTSYNNYKRFVDIVAQGQELADNNISELDDRYYEHIVINEVSEVESSDSVIFILFRDITQAYQIFADGMKELIIISIFIIALAVVMMYAALRGVIGQVQKLLDIFPDIGNKYFDLARGKLQLARTGAKDEMLQIFNATTQLNDTLADLYHELDDKNLALRSALSEITDKHQFIDKLLNSAEVMIITANSNYKITSYNAYSKNFVISNAVEKSEHIRHLLGLSNEAFHQQVVQQLADNDLQRGIRVETSNTGENNEQQYFSWILQEIGSGGDLLAIGQDITERKESEAKILQYAENDELTGLSNRRKFINLARNVLIDREIISKGFLVLYIDVNHFKLVNDRYGHDVGDALLVHISQVISAELGILDFAARFGGDEFVLGLVKRSTEEACQIAQNILTNTREHPFYVESLGVSIDITLSIGIAQYDQNKLSIEQLIANADAAMYENKATRLGTYRLYNGNETRIDELKSLQKWGVLISEKLDKDLVSCRFQGVYDVNDQSINQYEVLACIEGYHEAGDDEDIVVADFIHFCEKSLLIDELDMRVIDKGLEKVSHLKHPPVLMFNISNFTLQRERFKEFLLGRLAYHGISAERIVLEITESQQIEDLEKVKTIINELKSQNIRVALDDYGDGYTSLTYLTALPIDYLKLDISLVRDIASDAKALAIVTSIRRLASSLGIMIIAEGVENQQQKEALEELGVDYLQGYYFSKPNIKLRLANTG